MSGVPSQALLGVFANATALAAVVLSSLIAGCAIYKVRVRRTGSDFSLGRLESLELDRAVLLYERVRERLGEIQCQYGHVTGSLLGKYRQRRTLRKQFAEEVEQLDAYATHLRATIIRLRRRPIARFRSWVHIASAHFAFSSGVVVYSAIWAVLIACSYFDQPLWQEKVTSVLDGFLLWKPVGSNFIFGDYALTSIAVVAMPVLYCARRRKLRRIHRLQFRELTAYAHADPDTLISQSRADEEEIEQAFHTDGTYVASPRIADETAWFDVLGVSPWASLDEVKQAYKSLVKQNHPDRVHGMSLAFQDLAETETRKLNAAYEQAILSLRAPITPALSGADT